MASSCRFFLWLFAICCSLMGVQFVYSIQFSLGSPLFKNELKLEQSVIAIILATAGPISGFVVQPVVGVWSDGCRARWGRRRPFILAGTIGCVIGMALIGASVDLGVLLGDQRGGATPHEHTWGIVLAISGLLIMNVFVNTIQGPARAIVLDLVPHDKQQDGNAMVSGVMGLSAIIANVIGVPMFDTDEPYRNLFFLGVGCVVLTVLPTLIVAKEAPAAEEEEDEISRAHRGVGGAFYKIYYAFRTIPKKMIIVVVVYFFSWCAYSPFMIYLTSFFSDNLYGGGAHTHKGIQMGMYGLAIFSFSQWLFSLVLAPFTRCLPVQWVYFITQLIATAGYLSFYYLQRIASHTMAVGITYAVMAIIAINFTTMNSLPFGLVRGITGTKNAGLYMGVLNAASVVAQTATNMLAGLVLTLTASHPSDNSAFASTAESSLASSLAPAGSVQNVTYAIVFGGGLSILASVFALFLREERAANVPGTAVNPEESMPLINDTKRN